MFLIPGWDDLFMTYQRDYSHIVYVLTRRSKEQGVIIVPDLLRVLDPFRLCSYNAVRLVILGQDPYKSNATGLAFSTEDGSLTPSLRVISSWLDYKDFNGNLTRWALQGVLLLNAVPTMETSVYPIPHRTLWESFIRGCLSLCSSKTNVAFLLLGTVASDYSDSIDSDNNLVIKTEHPSYYARLGIYEKKDIFDNINSYLSTNNKGIINFL